MPAPHHRNKIEALVAAYSLLGITPDEVASAPKITPLFALIEKTSKRAGQPRTRRKLVIRHPDDSTERVARETVEDKEIPPPYGPGSDLLSSWPMYLSMSPDVSARRVLMAYNSLPPTLRQRASLPIEAYCVAASVSPHAIMEILLQTALRASSQSSALITSMNMPRVVQKSVEVALTDEGIADRTLLAKATGFLPSPKGSQININTNATANAAAAPVLAPSPESTSRRLAERLAEVRGLPTAPPSALDVITSPPAPAREPVTIDVSADDANEEYTE